jgi:hypothetical protein
MPIIIAARGVEFLQNALVVAIHCRAAGAVHRPAAAVNGARLHVSRMSR